MTIASGKPLKLRAQWNGESPEVGDFLMSQAKPRYAYRILTVARRSGGRLELTVERVLVTDVPENATVHGWQWDSRTRKREAWSAVR